MALAVETLFLVNLMLMPFIGFLGIVYLFVRHRQSAPPLALNHLWQTLGVGVVGGMLLVFVIVLILLIGGLDSGYTWMIVILYFTLIHTSMIFLGAIGLSKALSGKGVCYPLLGKWFLKYGPIPKELESTVKPWMGG